MSALVASLALVTALSRHSAPSALATHPIACAPNTDISSSGCGNTGVGNSGVANVGNGNSGAANTGNANSGLLNTGNANSGVGNVGNGNSGCGNNGTANSGGGNTGTGNSGGFSCHGFTPPPPTTVVTFPGTTLPGHTTTTLKKAPVPAQVLTELAFTGRDSAAPLTLALGLLLTGAAAAGLANRRRHAMAAASGGNLLPLSAAVGLLLTGRAKVTEPEEQSRS
jgi:PPE-repeat protein